MMRCASHSRSHLKEIFSATEQNQCVNSGSVVRQQRALQQWWQWLVNIITAGGTGWSDTSQCRLNTQSSNETAWCSIDYSLMLLYCIIYHRMSSSQLLVHGECILRGFNSLPPGSLVPNIYYACPAIQTLLPHDIFIQLCFISRIQNKKKWVLGVQAKWWVFSTSNFYGAGSFWFKTDERGRNSGRMRSIC